MKTKLLLTIGVVLLILVPFTSCEKGKNNPERYSFWKGDIVNYYYILDMNEKKLHLVKGKPFMVMEYDPLSGAPIRCEFGLSEAKNEYLPGVQGAIPEPFLYASDLEYAKKLNLTGSAALLIGWGDGVTVNEQLTAGGYRFSVDKGSDLWGHEILKFTFTNEGMEGEINNATVGWGGRISDGRAFMMLRKFNSNSLK